MMKKQLFAGAAALAFAGGATAADPVGNFLAGLDGAAVNLDATLDALVVGNSSGTADSLTALVTEFSVTVSKDTAGEDLAVMGADLGNQLNDTGQQFLYPLLDQLTMPGAEPLAPFAQFYLASGVLAQGIPFVTPAGDVTFFNPGGASSLEGFGLPVSTLADLIGPGGQLSTLLGEILAGGAPGGGAFALPLPGLGDGPEGGLPGADSLLGLLSVGSDGLGPEGLLALLPIPGSDGAEGGLPGLDALLVLLPIGGGDDSPLGALPLGPDALLALLPIPGGDGAEGGLPGLDALLVLIPMGGDGSPLGALPLGPDALLGLLSSFSLPGLNGA
ncbi:hypothetical protein [Spectribacter hydrogenoxidans]|uniref:Uncharacterized protein n=1 Tax=Spectribacter hydrogenoxidans TaxID=3075608 RepID=A0ABU3C118_9GAMM|nr:hypothetical protein [Salinisphaera sp. W335]MDT0635243.1 hypothetical protein [Salinisphaera sp. W335]